ncbi:hypothetical protein [Sphingomonas sp. 22176]|uniref:hypothetical protein n=1 Tax=Sphingomonas sp. 22176 TaxID=3453884 RepID=UPI003F840623
MKGSENPRSAASQAAWYLLAAFGIAMLVNFMITDLLGITSHDEPSTAYASLLEGS